MIERPPSAELRPDQKDTDSLPPYAELDPIIAAWGPWVVVSLIGGIILLASPFSWIWFRKLRMASETKDHFASLLFWMCLAMAGVAILILGCGILYGKALVAWIFGGDFITPVVIQKVQPLIAIAAAVANSGD